MNGRPLTINISVFLLLLAIGSGPAPALAADHSPGPIAILLSDREEAYTRPVAVFTHEIQLPVRMFNLEGDIDRAPRLMAEILSLRPALIFTLGAKATCTAKIWTADRPDIPVLFAMVLNWQRYGLGNGQENMAGIASEVAPGTEFVYMISASSKVKRIGVVYDEAYSEETLKRGRAAAEKLGLTLVATTIDQPREFRQAYKRIRNRIDGYWLLADPVVYTRENVNWLEEQCVKDRMVCLGQSKNIAQMGILLAVDPDSADIGLQAASLAKGILIRHQPPSKIGVMPPLGTKLILNRKTAEKIGLHLNRAILDVADDIIDW
jgi:putative tryptophan/tyrosine transport system substrate-binding protein